MSTCSVSHFGAVAIRLSSPGLVTIALWRGQRENHWYMEPETHYAKSGAFAFPVPADCVKSG